MFDPFAGSGTTLVAEILEGTDAVSRFSFISLAHSAANAEAFARISFHEGRFGTRHPVHYQVLGD